LADNWYDDLIGKRLFDQSSGLNRVRIPTAVMVELFMRAAQRAINVIEPVCLRKPLDGGT